VINILDRHGLSALLPPACQPSKSYNLLYKDKRTPHKEENATEQVRQPSLSISGRGFSGTIGSYSPHSSAYGNRKVCSEGRKKALQKPTAKLCRQQRCARKSDSAWEKWDDKDEDFGGLSTAVQETLAVELLEEETATEAGEDGDEDFDWRAELKLMEEENKRNEVTPVYCDAISKGVATAQAASHVAFMAIWAHESWSRCLKRGTLYSRGVRNGIENC